MSRILVGNDQQEMVDVCQMVLESAGHTVRTVLDGEQALALALVW